MSRRKRIPVVEDGLDDRLWLNAGRRLREINPGEFLQLLALAEAYVSNHEREFEPLEDFNARLAVLKAKTSQEAN